MIGMHIRALKNGSTLRYLPHIISDSKTSCTNSHPILCPFPLSPPTCHPTVQPVTVDNRCIGKIMAVVQPSYYPNIH